MNKVLKIGVGNKNYPTNCYIIYDENNQGIVIDPGYDYNKINKEIESNKIDVKAIILTHVHSDHSGALKELEEQYNPLMYMHLNGVNSYNKDEKSYYTLLENKYFELDEIKGLKDKDVIKISNIELEVIHTPGHTDCSICLYNKENNILFTGDTLFHNCYGRCDLETSSIEDMKVSLNKLFERFKEVIIYPGHEQSVNISYAEKRVNLLLKIKGE